MSMVSDMESNRLDPAEARRIAERAEAAPYVDYPPTPWWYYPVVGAFMAVLAYLTTRTLTGGASATPGVFLLLAGELLFIRWLSRRQGALPSFRHPPTEFRSVLTRFVVGAVVVVAVVAIAGALGGPLASAATAFVAVTVGLVAYERTFATAADRLRERLA